jgi:anti-sigma regulatory factor (Ser/Thr protein kinase)
MLQRRLGRHEIFAAQNRLYWRQHKRGGSPEADYEDEIVLYDSRTLETLKTALAEATTNAMEHGNRYDPNVPVKIQVWLLEERPLVRIIDRGSGPPPSPNAVIPDLEAKLAGAQTRRGWGLFLIQKMVDEMRVSGNPDHHTIELVVHL